MTCVRDGDSSPTTTGRFPLLPIDAESCIAIIPMAWDMDDSKRPPCQSDEPDELSLKIWVSLVARSFRPKGQRVVYIFCNRAGRDDKGVTYTGSSAVISVTDDKLILHGVLHRDERKVLVVNTDKSPFPPLPLERELAEALTEALLPVGYVAGGVSEEERSDDASLAPSTPGTSIKDSNSVRGISANSSLRESVKELAEKDMGKIDYETDEVCGEMVLKGPIGKLKLEIPKIPYQETSATDADEEKNRESAAPPTSAALSSGTVRPMEASTPYPLHGPQTSLNTPITTIDESPMSPSEWDFWPQEPYKPELGGSRSQKMAEAQPFWGSKRPLTPIKKNAGLWRMTPMCTHLANLTGGQARSMLSPLQELPDCRRPASPKCNNAAAIGFRRREEAARCAKHSSAAENQAREISSHLSRVSDPKHLVNAGSHAQKETPSPLGRPAILPAVTVGREEREKNAGSIPILASPSILGTNPATSSREPARARRCKSERRAEEASSQKRSGESPTTREVSRGRRRQRREYPRIMVRSPS